MGRVKGQGSMEQLDRTSSELTYDVVRGLFSCVVDGFVTAVVSDIDTSTCALAEEGGREIHGKYIVHTHRLHSVSSTAHRVLVSGERLRFRGSPELLSAEP